MKGIKVLFVAVILCLLVFTGNAYSLDETALFTSAVPPDALILLDLSASMNWTPGGEEMYTNTPPSDPCPDRVDGSSSRTYYSSPTGSYTYKWCIDSYGTVPKWGDASCSGSNGFFTSSTGRTDCSRLAIAKRAIADLLDDNEDNAVNSTDEGRLNVRLGYMRWYGCSDDTHPPSEETGGSPTQNYSTGCNTLIKGLGESFRSVFCGITSGSTTCGTNATSCSRGICVAGEAASGGTPIASGLAEAQLYLDADKAGDTAAACRPKFVILVTDGADTYACNGNGQESQSDQYMRRKATVAKTKALADLGYKVFVV
ncbi:MAG: VWA domain-containing protein, partial [Nitrospirales bacterium]|nr:VWA domain-containing protein [Nitrospirales bacterium]